MILVTRLNGSPMILNSDLIKIAEASPDTMLTLLHGEKLIVRESCEEVMERIVAYRAMLLSRVAAGETTPQCAESLVTVASLPVHNDFPLDLDKDKSSNGPRSDDPRSDDPRSDHQSNHSSKSFFSNPSSNPSSNSSPTSASGLPSAPARDLARDSAASFNHAASGHGVPASVLFGLSDDAASFLAPRLDLAARLGVKFGARFGPSFGSTFGATFKAPARPGSTPNSSPSPSLLAR